MKRILSLLLVISLLLTCAFVATAEEEKVAYRTLYSSEVSSLNYLTTATTSEFSIGANLVDTLVEYDCYGRMEPSLAEDWTISDDGLVYTFNIRKGCTWVNSKGEYYADVTANDFVASAKYILTAANDSATADQLYNYVVGAEEYFNSTIVPGEGEEAPAPVDFEVVGVKALDDYTLEYTLKEPTPYFLSMLSYVSYMPVCQKFLDEVGENFGLPTGVDNLLYCGAYYLSEFKPQESRVYTKNPTNWDADSVHIDEIRFIFNKEADTISPELYLQGEVDDATITATLAEQWLADPEKKDLIRPVRATIDYSYFFCFNFDPQFDAEYEPENWKLAVNNENFRKSFFYGLDRIKAKTVIEPDNPELLLANTITMTGFAGVNGKDFTQYEGLSKWADMGVEELYNEELALEYRDKAIEELTAAGATFPIVVLMPYNPSSSGNDEICVVIKQQMEALLGTNYIRFEIPSGPESGFLTEVRRSGKYAFLLCNWGADFADPVTFADPFDGEDNNYNFLFKMEDNLNEDGTTVYDTKFNEASTIVMDLDARYAALAELEGWLIDHAVIIPNGINDGGYTAGRIDPFTTQYSAFGVSNYRYKDSVMLDHPMSTDEYFDALDAWEATMAEIALNAAE